MKYAINKNKIIIHSCDEFNPKHIFECGQIFRYQKLENGDYQVISSDKKAVIHQNNTTYEIICDLKDIYYFINFFDLETNYTKIKNQLINQYTFLDKAITFGYGIRILKQSVLEVIISFIISANNNIKRIQASIEYICLNAGTKNQDFYAFPTINQLSMLDETFFKKAGLGYRASQMVQAIKQLQDIDLQYLQTLTTQKAKDLLISLSGIGPKVSDCILLFGLNKKDVFPVDTWINKVYQIHFNNQITNRQTIRENLISTFGTLSGFAQQYLFYWKRSEK